ERKFSYFASDAFDSRGLGERHWVNRLDRPAVQAMRSGGRIIDAVKNTVTSIESSLTRKIDEEKERKRLAALKRQQALEEAKLYPGQLRSLIKESSSRAETLRQENNGLTGSIVRPNVAAWEAEATLIERLAEQGDTQNARKHFAETQNEINSFHSGLDRWEKDAPRFESLIEEINSHPVPTEAAAVAGHLSTALQSVTSAASNHAEGDPLYREQLNTAERTHTLARDRYREWVASERQRQLLIQSTLVILLLAGLVFLGVANILRRKSRNESTSLFATWQTQLAGKFDELFQLMDRTGLVLGSSHDVKERGFVGTTETLALSTIRGVDELFIMSAATDRVMEEVEKLIQPSSWIRRVFNLFSSRNYRQAVSLLTSDPIGFDQKDHLEAILAPSPDPEPTPRRTLLGETEDYEPFRISFEQLMAEYDSRHEKALAGIGRLESGIDGLPITLLELQTASDRHGARADLLAAAAETDRIFSLESLRETLLPALQESMIRSSRLGENDPVAAFETLLPTSKRIETEIASILKRIGEFRETDLARVQGAKQSLNNEGRSTNWVEERLGALSTRSEQLASQAAAVAVAEAWADFDDDLTRLKGSTLACRELSRRIIDEMDPLIEKREQEIHAARALLSKELGQDPGNLLSEKGLSPDGKIQQARDSLAFALSSIDEGHPVSAREAMAEAEAQLDEVLSLIAISQISASEHARLLLELTEGHRAVSDEVAPAETLLTELKENYDPAVLTFASRFGEEASGQTTISESATRARRRLEQSSHELGDSSRAFNQGELIKAYGLLETVANELDFARHQLGLIRDQHKALREAEEKNRDRSQSLETRHRELSPKAQDRRTSQATIDSHSASGETITAFTTLLNEPLSNPFTLLREGEEIEGQLNQIEDGIESDWKTFQSAESASTGAKAALTFCHTYLKEARSDDIPDSRTLTRAIQRHAELTEQHKRIEKRLEEAHQDWIQVFAEISEITGETAKVKSTLQSELAAARDAADQLAQATAAIASLHKWRSRHSVRAERHAGRDSHLRAKQMLFEADYARARKAAVHARGEALRELQKAKLAEARKVSAAAALKRRAASSALSFGSSGSSFGSSFRGSSSSGFSSSSFSSGSGFSRSGW
ncbi:MAG: hypothetical protein AAGA96_17085, partial [Verrucomicrobiota bacterium]